MGIDYDKAESPPRTFSLIDCPFYTFISCKYKTDFKKVKDGTDPRNYSIEDFFTTDKVRSKLIQSSSPRKDVRNARIKSM
jgi:hypothetical protein